MSDDDIYERDSAGSKNIDVILFIYGKEAPWELFIHNCPLSSDTGNCLLSSGSLLCSCLKPNSTCICFTIDATTSLKTKVFSWVDEDQTNIQFSFSYLVSANGDNIGNLPDCSFIPNDNTQYLGYFIISNISITNTSDYIPSGKYVDDTSTLTLPTSFTEATGSILGATGSILGATGPILGATGPILGATGPILGATGRNEILTSVQQEVSKTTRNFRLWVQCNGIDSLSLNDAICIGVEQGSVPFFLYLNTVDVSSLYNEKNDDTKSLDSLLVGGTPTLTSQYFILSLKNRKVFNNLCTLYIPDKEQPIYTGIDINLDSPPVCTTTYTAKPTDLEYFLYGECGSNATVIANSIPTTCVVTQNILSAINEQLQTIFPQSQAVGPQEVQIQISSNITANVTIPASALTFDVSDLNFDETTGKYSWIMNSDTVSIIQNPYGFDFIPSDVSLTSYLYDYTITMSTITSIEINNTTLGTSTTFDLSSYSSSAILCMQWEILEIQYQSLEQFIPEYYNCCFSANPNISSSLTIDLFIAVGPSCTFSFSPIIQEESCFNVSSTLCGNSISMNITFVLPSGESAPNTIAVQCVGSNNPDTVNMYISLLQSSLQLTAIQEQAMEGQIYILNFNSKSNNYDSIASGADPVLCPFSMSLSSDGNVSSITYEPLPGYTYANATSSSFLYPYDNGSYASAYSNATFPDGCCILISEYVGYWTFQNGYYQMGVCDSFSPPS